VTRPDGIEIKNLIYSSFPSRCVPMDGSLPLAWFYPDQQHSEWHQTLVESLRVTGTSFPFSQLTKMLLPAGKTPSHCMEGLTVQDQESHLERTRLTMTALMLL